MGETSCLGVSLRRLPDGLSMFFSPTRCGIEWLTRRRAVRPDMRSAPEPGRRSLYFAPVVLAGPESTRLVGPSVQQVT